MLYRGVIKIEESRGDGTYCRLAHHIKLYAIRFRASIRIAGDTSADQLVVFR
jgi:hypothetical protein